MPFFTIGMPAEFATRERNILRELNASMNQDALRSELNKLLNYTLLPEDILHPQPSCVAQQLTEPNQEITVPPIDHRRIHFALLLLQEQLIKLKAMSAITERFGEGVQPTLECDVDDATQTLVVYAIYRVRGGGDGDGGRDSTFTVRYPFLLMPCRDRLDYAENITLSTGESFQCRHFYCGEEPYWVSKLTLYTPTESAIGRTC